MKHGQNNRRQRSRNNGRRYPNQRGNSFESNGPDIKVRGTAQQVLDKYQSLARDAFSTGDRVLAEGYLQHAEHYHRIMQADKESQQQRDNSRGRDNRQQAPEEASADSPAAEANTDASPAEAKDVPSKSDGGDVSKPGAEQPVVAVDAALDAASESNVASNEDATDAPRKRRSRRPRRTDEGSPEQTSAAD